MAEGLQHWLNDEANLKINVNSFEKEFSNGYYLGKILFNFGVLPNFLDHFQNRPQAVYRATHYDILKPILTRLGIEFDDNLQRSIKKEELGAAKKLLFRMKAELTKLKEKVDFTNKANMTEATWSIHNRAKRMNMCGKVEKTELRLVPFEEEFLRQKLQVKNKKEEDEKKYKDAVQVFRGERIKNLMQNHNYMNEWEDKLDTLWKHSRATMKELKDAKVRFNCTMTDKIRSTEDRRAKVFRNDFQKGIKGFEDNANRLGVELYHDPDRTDKVEKAPFNLASLMDKVKSKGELNEISRKQKDSRARYLKLKQAKLAEELAKQNDEKTKIDRYIQKSKIHLAGCTEVFLSEDQGNFIAGQREKQFLERKAKNSSKMEDIVKNLKTMSDEEYQKQNREKRFNKQVATYQERRKEYDYNYFICKGVVDALFEMSDACVIKLESESKGAQGPNSQISVDYFKKLLKKFTGQETMYDEKPEMVELKSTIMTYTKMKNLDVTMDITNSVINYFRSAGSFCPPLTYGVIMDKNRPKEILDEEAFPRCMESLINMIYPTNLVQPFPNGQETNNLIPLRLCILGDAFVGKKTVAKKLCTLFGLPIIDINSLIAKAKSFLKSEETNSEEIEGLKKKPVPPVRSGAMGKKATEAALVQLNDTELEFQKYGVKIKNLETAGRPIPDDVKIDLILLELKPIVLEKKFEELRHSYTEAKKKAEDKRTARLSKVTEPVNTDPRKQDKSRGVTKNASKDTIQSPSGPASPVKKLGTEEEFLEEVYPYTKGYILLNYPATQEQAHIFNRRLTNYIPLAERLNLECEEKKEKMRMLIPVPEMPPEKNSFPPLDFVFVLDLNKDQIMERALKLRLDPSTGTLYDPVINPAPEADKKLQTRLEPVKLNNEIINASADQFDQNRVGLQEYYKLFGFEGHTDNVYQEIDASLPPGDIDRQILNLIKHLLKYKYTWYERPDGLPTSISHLIAEHPQDNLPEVSETTSQKERGAQGTGQSQLLNKPSLRDIGNIHSPGQIAGSGLHFSPHGGNQSRLVKKGSFQSSIRGSYRNLSTKSGGGSRKERFIHKCLESWDCIFNDFVNNLKKNITTVKENFEVIRFSLENSQLEFAKIFREKRDFSAPLLNFVETYKRFVQENPEAINHEHCKKQMYQKIDALHDTLWKQISDCQVFAKGERAKISSKSLVANNVQGMCKFVLNMVANELNKIFHMKNMLSYYFAVVNEVTSESAVQSVDFGSMELRDDEMPKINEKEHLPLDFLNYVRDKAITFLKNIQKVLDSRRGNLPKDLYMSLKTNSILAEKSIESIRAYAIHKIKKFKVRQTLVEHRLEEWIIYSVKTRNAMIYEVCNRLRDCVKEGHEEIDLNWVPFYPLEHKAVMNFKLGPSNLKLRESLIQSEEFPMISQLFMIFTDVRNLCVSTVKDEISLVEEDFGEDEEEKDSQNISHSPRFGNDLSSPTKIIDEEGLKIKDSMTILGDSAHVQDMSSFGKHTFKFGMEIDFETLEKFTLDEIIQLFRYRVKNNTIGNITYLPSKWNDFKYKKLYHIFSKLTDDKEIIYFVYFGLLFTLMRYPIPTSLELSRLKQSLDTVTTKEDFSLTMCWLDEFDEINCVEKITEKTPFVTAKTKEMLFWLFSYRDGFLNKDLFLHFLSKHVSTQSMTRSFGEIFGFAPYNPKP